MLSLLGLDYMASDALTLIALGGIAGAMLIGFISDSLMGPMGFGVFINGIIALAGATLGLMAWKRFFPPMGADNVLPLMVVVIAGAFATLLTLAFARRYG